MKYSITFTPKARQNINDIAVAIFSLSKNNSVTIKIIDRLTNAINQLADFPLSGKLPIDVNLLNLGYRYLIERDYLIFYKVDSDSGIVNIQAILNGKTDYVKWIANNI